MVAVSLKSANGWCFAHYLSWLVTRIDGLAFGELSSEQKRGSLVSPYLHASFRRVRRVWRVYSTEYAGPSCRWDVAAELASLVMEDNCFSVGIGLVGLRSITRAVMRMSSLGHRSTGCDEALVALGGMAHLLVAGDAHRLR